MIYCMSDIHGMESLFNKMLERIDLQQGDTLYVLGDCIDRGGGLSTLQHIMRLQEKGVVKFIRGNHETSFAENIQKYDPKLTLKLIKSYSVINRDKSKYSLWSAWNRLENAVKYVEYTDKIQLSAHAAAALSGYRSFYSCNDFFALSEEDQRGIISFIQEAPTYVDIAVAGKKFRLTHAGCNQDGSVSDDIRQEFYTQKTPFDDITVVFGHTTTKDIRILTGDIMEDPAIWYDTLHNHDKIGIDCGAPFEHGKLACLRLDDMAEFYVENELEPADILRVYNDYAECTGQSVTLDGKKRFEEYLRIWQEERRKISPKEKGERVNSNIDKMPISASLKKDLKQYLQMIHNYAELVKNNPSNQTYQAVLLDYTRKAEKLCKQNNIDVNTVIY